MSYKFLQVAESETLRFSFCFFLLVLLTTGLSSEGFAQKNKRRAQEPADPLFDNSIIHPRVRSVQLYRDQNELSYPILEMNKPGQLLLEFDQLDVEFQSYNVKIQHCTPDWKPSSLFPMDFYQGFVEAPIQDFQLSRNTLVPYVHYKYAFPKAGDNFLHSGNFILQVVANDRTEQVILSRRFVVAEPLVRIGVEAGLSPDIAQRRALQSVNFNIFPGNVNINDAFADTRVCVLQNFRWDTRRCGLRPAYIYPERLEYRFEAANDFPGGNEYRFFDLRNVQRQGGRLRQIMLTDSGIFVRLENDRIRSGKAYVTDPDFNGNFYTGIKQFTGSEVESDYINVRFVLESRMPLDKGNVYIFGGITDWKLDPRFGMRYDPAGFYFQDVLLKQGIYNYHFVVNEPYSEKIDETRLEGNFFETENYYTVLVYLKQPQDREHRLVGFQHINYYE